MVLACDGVKTLWHPAGQFLESGGWEGIFPMVLPYQSDLALLLLFIFTCVLNLRILCLISVANFLF